MTLPELIAFVDSGIRLGHTATEIVERLCCEHGGEAVPSIEEFEARVDALRNTPDLSPGAKSGK